MAVGTALAIAGAASAVGGGVAKGIAAGKQAKAATAQQRLALSVAKMTPLEMREYEKGVKESERMLIRERKLLDAVDPSLIEAGNQAFQILRGKEAAILDPLRRQRERQRKTVEESLRRQLGPGFDTSSAGIEALARFDQGTADVLADAQQSTAMQLLSASQGTRAQAQAGLGQAFQVRQGATGILQNVAARRTAAATGTAPGVVNTAGQGLAGVGDVLGGLGTFGLFGASNIAQGKGFFGFDKAGARSDITAIPVQSTETFQDIGGFGSGQGIAIA